MSNRDARNAACGRQRRIPQELCSPRPVGSPAARARSRRGRRVPAPTARAVRPHQPRNPHRASVSSAFMRKKRVSPHPAAHIAGPLARTTRQEVRRARGPGRSIVAVGAGRPLRSFRSPPAGRFGPSAQVPTGHALPSGALRAAFRIPGAFPKSSIWRRHPARARDRLPASSGRPASLTCAVDSAALRKQGYLTPAGAPPTEKIGASRSFPPRSTASLPAPR